MIKSQKSKVKSQKFYYLVLIVILVFSLFFRLNKLSERDFWYDEAVTGLTIRGDYNKMFDLILLDMHPPLYFVGAKVLSSFFGYSVYGIRLYSVVWGVLAVWGVYLFCKELINKYAALYSSLLVAVSPFLIQYSQEGRMYSQVATLLIFSAYFLLKAYKTDKIYYFLLCFLFTASAFFTHYLAFIFFILHYCVFISLKFFRARGKNHFSFKYFFKINKKILFSIVLSLSVCALWWPSFSYQYKNQDDKISWVTRADYRDIPKLFEIFIFGSPPGQIGMPEPNKITFLPVGFVHFITASIFLVVFFSAYLSSKKVFFVLASYIFGFILPFFFISKYFDINFFVSRYLIGASLFYFCLFGWWLSRLKIGFSLYIILVYIILIFNINSFHNGQGYNQLYANREEYNQYGFYSMEWFDYLVSLYYFPNKAEYYRCSEIGYANKENKIIIINKNIKFSDCNFDAYNKINQFDNLSLYLFK